MRLLTMLPVAMVLLLWAAADTGLGRVATTLRRSCDVSCASAVFYIRQDGRAVSMTPQDREQVQRLETILSNIKPNEEWVRFTINGQTVEVPSSLEANIKMILMEFPQLLILFKGILLGFQKPGMSGLKSAPAYQQNPQIMTTPARRRVPKARTRRTQKPWLKVTRMPTLTENVQQGSQTHFKFEGNYQFQLPSSNMPMPDISHINYITAVPGIDPKALTLVGYLFSQPNYFSVVYQMLIQHGFKFPSLNAPITSVTWRSQVIRFPRPLVVSYTVKVAGGVFQLPRDAAKLAVYLSTHTEELPSVATFLRQLGGVYSISGGSQITGFTIFNQFYRFTKPVVTTVIVSGRSYALPKDIDAILAAVKNNPQEFFRIQMLLEAFGVNFTKSSTAIMQGLHNDKWHNINIIRGVRIEIDNKFYDIPADLETIFKKLDGFKVGALLSALQEKGIPVKVDEKTGVIIGIVIDKVLVPFPATIDLRFKMDNTVYMIPRDLQKLITVLEKKNMPTKILSILYNRYGVIPVRNADNVVSAISFNGKKYPVKVEPLTAVVIRSRKFLLPRDTDKMIDFVQSLKQDKTIGFEFLKALKVAGFMLVNDDDGAMRSIQKGAQVIKLGMELRVTVLYRDTLYKVPQDLMRLVNEIRKSGQAGIAQVTEQLKAFDVEVIKKGSKLTILFNSVMYVVDMQSGSVKG